MWQERLKIYREERETELNKERDALKKDEWLEDIIEKEKQRLLQEHLPYIDGFLPKGIVANENDSKYFANTTDFHNAQLKMSYK